jgi:chromate transporter
MTDPSNLTMGQLAGIFFRTGSLAFGGGGSTLAMLHHEFCARRQLMSDEEFQLLFGISRLVPGMNLLSLTVLLGHRTHGLPGSLTALVGLTVPSFTLILLGCHLLRGGHPGPFLAGALRGLSVAVAALLIHTTWQLCQGTLARQAIRSRILWLALLAAGLVFSRVSWINPAWIVAGGGLLGMLLSPVIRRQAP